jgi:hypothetical protein
LRFVEVVLKRAIDVAIVHSIDIDELEKKDFQVLSLKKSN